MVKLQVIATSPRDCQIISQAGGDRIELVSALQLGGLTPSPYLLRKSLESSSLPTMVMIRHHNKGFHLTQEENNNLLHQSFKVVDDYAPSGIVVGALDSIGCIEQIFLNQLTKNIGGKVEITFHKAIDYCSDIRGAYHNLHKYGITRLLTQGGKLPMLENGQLLKQMIEDSKRQQWLPRVLLGGGIKHTNIKQILTQLSPQEIHVGTCVRQDIYGNIQASKISQMVNLLK